MKRVILVMMLLLSINSIKAQNDPVLAGMILLYTEKAEKTLKNQELAMMMQTRPISKQAYRPVLL